MEQDIKILEDYIKLINKGYCDDCNELCNIYSTPAFPSRAIKRAIENLIKERQLDKERIKELEGKYNYEKNRARTELDRVYINARYDEKAKWQSLIKEKIEELNTMITETHRGNLQRYTVSEILSFIRFCEELLGEEK